MLIEFQMEIQAPVEVAFSYLEDQEKQKKWMNGLERTEYLTPVDPANPVGVKFIQHLREGGRVQAYEGQVIEFQKNNLLSIQLYHSAFLIEVRYRLEALSDASCRLLLTENIQANNLFGKVMSFVFQGMMKRALKKQMTLFKESVERALRE